MSSTIDRTVFAISVSELREVRNVWRSTMTTFWDMSEGFSVDPATKYLVTFEMTIKPLPEELSISDSHPPTDGSER